MKETKEKPKKANCSLCGKEIDLTTKEWYFSDSKGYICVECIEG